MSQVDVEATPSAASPRRESRVLRASARIILESFAYRLRMREANNLPVVVTLAIASHLPVLGVAARTLIAVLLNVLVYLTNDYCDIEIDLDSAEQRPQVAFLAANRAAARVALWALTLLMVGAGAGYGTLFGSWWPLIGAVAGALVVWAYSAGLKRVPVMDILSMTVAGACGALLAVRGGSAREAWHQSPGLRVAGFLGLVCGSFNALQVVRDHDTDTRANVRTSAVVFGPAVTGWIFRVLVISSALYGYFIAHSYASLAMLAAAVLAVRPGSAARAWDITRIIGALAWIGVLVELFLNRL